MCERPRAVPVLPNVLHLLHTPTFPRGYVDPTGSARIEVGQTIVFNTAEWLDNTSDSTQADYEAKASTLLRRDMNATM